jgi:hypothetical protein
MRTLPRAAILAGLSSLLGCGPSAPPAPSAALAGAPLAVDAWIRFPIGAASEGSTTLAAELVVPVADARQGEAQDQLAQQAWKLLDHAEAKRLVDARVDLSQRGGVPVLLRSVRSVSDGSGLEKDDRYVVREKRGVVVVSHLSARRTPPRQQRHALIAFLPAEPVEVYVECVSAIGDLPGK